VKPSLSEKLLDKPNNYSLKAVNANLDIEKEIIVQDGAKKKCYIP
jgi:hypothetical protein